MAALREIIAHFGITFDDAGLKKGGAAVEGLIDQVKGFAGTLGAGLAIGAIYHFVTSLAEEADALQKQSDALGLSIEEMQQWQYAAMMQGVSSEALTGVLAKLGAGKFDKGLAALGVAATDTAGKARNSTDILEDVADALASIENPAERNRKAIGVLGKNYVKLMPLLQDGAKGIKELRDEFEALGGGFTKEFALQADELGDNIDRMKTVWKNLQITVLSAVLPMFLSLSKQFFALMKPLVALIKHSKVMEAGFVALGLKGLIFLSGKIGPLGNALKMLSKQFFTVIVPLLILEDFLVFLAGGDSLIGRLIDKVTAAFGITEGSAKFRAWIGEVWSSFQAFISDLRSNPMKLLEDWEFFTESLKKDVVALFGDTFGGILVTAGQVFMTILDLLTGGWTNFTTKAGALWDGFCLALQIGWLEWKTGILIGIAEIEDNFLRMWNGILINAQNVLGLVGKVAGALGHDTIQKGIQDVAGGLGGGKASVDNVSNLISARNAERANIATAGDAIAAKLSVDGGRPAINAPVSVQVNVPPGTPESMAKRVGDAAASGAQRGNMNLRAAQAALKPGGA